MYANLPNFNSAVAVSDGGAKIIGRAARKRLTNSLPARKHFSNQILDALREEDLARLLPFLESIDLKEGESIYQPDDKIRYLYFPEDAVVSQYYILEDGRSVEIAMIGRDGLTGQASVFGCSTADCWTQVSIAGKAMRISAEAVKQEFARGGSLHALVLEYANNFTAQLARRVVCNNYHSVERRFCSWLMMICDRHGAEKINLTHNQIAGYLGVHRPSFTHIAKSLRSSGIIDYVRGNLKILNRRALLASACECYSEMKPLV